MLSLKQRIATVDEEIEALFFCHPQAAILASLPGMGPRLGAEFLVAVGDAATFERRSIGRLRGPRTGRTGFGQEHRQPPPHGGNKALKRVFYQSAFVSLRTPESRRFYDRKRAEGKRHHQAVIALARRRLNVLWAMLRDPHAVQAVLFGLTTS